MGVDEALPAGPTVADASGPVPAARSVLVRGAPPAATAQVQDLALVSRNTASVGGLGMPVLNPFDEARP